ncbi:SDR family NAD(P)-dependent oxidoreductase [Streptomyces sp. NPDC052101]|uniref:SDR family NAD(P)-dependent oxidoreductase n=1 Tax=Streptomyces sp. NPDC052101 TaxID=3155763 RepID=UPI0034133B5C
MGRFEGRRVLVTGGGSGIGRATVLRILREGGSVVAADISEAGLKETAALAEGLADRLHTQVLDVSDESSVRAGVAAGVTGLGGLDALVNSAGILRSAHTHETTLDSWNRTIAVNLTGTFLTTREALPALLAGGKGVVVNFSSTSASFAHPYMAAYAASKGGIQSFTHAIALEYAKQGLRAVCVAPGSISSGMTDGSGGAGQNSGPGLPEDTDWELFAKLRPALFGEGYADARTGFADAGAVAGVVAMLASDDGAFITGTEIRVDGGTHM